LPKDAEAAIRKLVDECAPIGAVTIEQIDRALPPRITTGSELEAIMSFIADNGLRVDED
jgi:hypothetical protein